MQSHTTVGFQRLPQCPSSRTALGSSGLVKLFGQEGCAEAREVLSSGPSPQFIHSHLRLPQALRSELRSPHSGQLLSALPASLKFYRRNEHCIPSPAGFPSPRTPLRSTLRILHQIQHIRSIHLRSITTDPSPQIHYTRPISSDPLSQIHPPQIHYISSITTDPSSSDP